MQTKKLDMLAIGESLRDIFYMIHEATVSCSLQAENCQLCLAYATKIPVREVVKVPAAGNAANAAVTCARLGMKSALVSWVGDDAEGANLKSALKRDGVDVRHVCDCAGQATSEATILSFKGEKTQLVCFKRRDYAIKQWPDARCLYYTAMGDKYGKVDRAVFAYLRRHPDAAFVFQPGTTHIRRGLPRLRKLIAASDAFIVNKEEAKSLLADDGHDMRGLLEGLHDLGAGFVVITNGDKGADAYNGLAHWHMPVFPGKSTESTGAGDAFASALACALIAGHDFSVSLRWGTANSWSAIRQIGPQKGLVTKKELDQILKRFRRVNPLVVND